MRPRRSCGARWMTARRPDDDDDECDDDDDDDDDDDECSFQELRRTLDDRAQASRETSELADTYKTQVAKPYTRDPRLLKLTEVPLLLGDVPLSTFVSVGSAR